MLFESSALHHCLRKLLRMNCQNNNVIILNRLEAGTDSEIITGIPGATFGINFSNTMTVSILQLLAKAVKNGSPMCRAPNICIVLINSTLSTKQA
ncbi:hypothetical protein ALP10_200106 [Pseudomonas syringae pv. helianthi]|uniref:Uncharacterized protein n=1 Tax=Pseudomonas syringae pv. helianthi TaxID=251654 RepID=A0A3M4RKE5_9PSED|nr:hypothetical protein ALP93_200132 [Pseudomonas syringae pv. helianthi]RMV48136.1 hypothetical protein ALP10_200106 [Pseudomonas syringae pv. helianthi]RMW15997.1 hypothetical protein ALO98_200264 [Pseudomonas syringae pv. tagetis]